MKAKKLLSIKTRLVATQAYLNRRSTPHVAADLKQHECIIDTAPGYFNNWPIKDTSATRGVAVSGQFVVNDGELAAELARAGRGIALLPETIVEKDLGSGQLVSVLDGASRPESDLHFVFPASRHIDPKVKAFKDACVTALCL
ncbi:hypothetical protein GCM10007385_32860 [Tateyamaria omphalii]|nr:hypothetical protein GCM10007385_32860 [Tateyamaria omphalii]